ncbi:helix-loop-helix protein delilah-like [Macrosteles quadrilineatus]|uniref:helix-loop-helix protein delilah-like n=1 Tax=Macrosteles quadrilineatus TaxID=74068 RepID=UPI0023E17848|nr:helix-loop-helix protein delilah-like [Macrosteles quadrilineatus]
MDSNKNFPLKSYSLRPRGIRKPKTSHPEAKTCRKTKLRSQPLSKYRRKTANERERVRMRKINEAFETLRRVTPQMASEECNGEKMTKISTLRLAMSYVPTGWAELVSSVLRNATTARPEPSDRRSGTW